MDEPHRIFISYSRRDFYFAEQLAVRLRRQGLEVWFDAHELGMGSDWAAEIDQGIAECDTFVLVASRAALESPWVQRERDRAAELSRPCVVVLPERTARSAAPPGLPTYDLTSSFRRGVRALARDLAGGSPSGRRPGLPLPWPEGACFVALTLALAVLFAVVLGVLFFRVALGPEARAAPDLGLYMLVASGMLAIAGGLPAYVLWSFLRRRVSWLWLIGAPVNLFLIVPLSYVTVDTLAGYAGDPLLRALGATSEDGYLGPTPIVLAGLVMVLCPAAAVVLVLSAGVCRFLRTGTAPERVRARHIGGVPLPDAESTAVRSYRLLAAEEDAGVADELRRSLSPVGIREVAEGEPRDRDVVVLSDRMPAAWLERDDLREPVAVVATSVALPVRGRLMRFQWVDYRARRRKTLHALARELAGDDSAAETRPTPLVPERLQQLRLPRPILIAEWTLYAMCVIAADMGVYGLTDVVLEDTSAPAWRSALFLAVAPVPVVLARRLRRRRITRLWLLGAVAAFWLALLAVGLDAFLQERFPTYDRGSYNAGTIIYPAIVAVVLALTWRSIRRWLPRRLRREEQAAPTLGYARGSRLWLVMAISAPATAVGTAALTTSTPATSLPAASPPAAGAPALRVPPTPTADMCRDRNALVTALQPLYNAPKLSLQATQQEITAWFENRSRIERDIIRELVKLEPAGSWGAETRARLVAALDRLARADRGYARREVSWAGWQETIRAFGVVNREVGTLRC